MKIKLTSLSANFRLSNSSKMHGGVKVELISKSNRVTKGDMKHLIPKFSSVPVLKFNSSNVSKVKKYSSVVFKKDSKYSKVHYYSKINNSKKFILTFRHSMDKSKFLSDIGIE